MTKDLRDPKDFGEALIWFAEKLMCPISQLSFADNIQTRRYDADPSCIEKYGRPQGLPSKLPN